MSNLWKSQRIPEGCFSITKNFRKKSDENDSYPIRNRRFECLNPLSQFRKSTHSFIWKIDIIDYYMNFCPEGKSLIFFLRLP